MRLNACGSFLQTIRFIPAVCAFEIARFGYNQILMFYCHSSNEQLKPQHLGESVPLGILVAFRDIMDLVHIQGSFCTTERSVERILVSAGSGIGGLDLC